MTGQQRLAIWSSRLDRYRQANQTVAEFCENEGVSAASFYNWKRRLADRTQATTPAKTKSNFVELTVRERNSHQPFNAHATLANGIRIELGDCLPVVQAIVEQLLRYQPDSSNQEAS
jgi:transposase-like protein